MFFVKTFFPKLIKISLFSLSLFSIFDLVWSREQIGPSELSSLIELHQPRKPPSDINFLDKFEIDFNNEIRNNRLQGLVNQNFNMVNIRLTAICRNVSICIKLQDFSGESYSIWYMDSIHEYQYSKHCGYVLQTVWRGQYYDATGIYKKFEIFVSDNLNITTYDIKL